MNGYIIAAVFAALLVTLMIGVTLVERQREKAALAKAQHQRRLKQIETEMRCLLIIQQTQQNLLTIAAMGYAAQFAAQEREAKAAQEQAKRRREEWLALKALMR